MTGNTLAIDRANTGAASPMSVDVDFSLMTQLTDTGSTLVMAQQDGSPIGTLSSFSIGADGLVTGTYSNGLTKQARPGRDGHVQQPAGPGRQRRQHVWRRRRQRRRA